MKNLGIIFYLLMMISPAIVFSQNDYDGEPCVVCDLECIECGMWTTLVNQLDTLMVEEGIGDGQGAICTILEHQITWYGFIAGSMDLEFSITNDSCVGGVNVEIGVFEGLDCNNMEQISDNCYGGANGNALSEGSSGTLSMTDLVIGQYYWLIFDNAADATGNCWYTLTVTSGSTGAPPITEVPEIDGPPVLCDNESGSYFISNEVEGASSFDWYVDSYFEDNSIEFEFIPPGIGTYQICATATSHCEFGPTSNPCFTVVVGESSTGTEALAICDGDCITYEGNSYCNGSIEQVVINNQIGCDSTIDLTIFNLLFDPVITAGNECFDGLGVDINLTPLDLSFPSLVGSPNISWEWYFEGTLIPSGTNMFLIYALESGDYSIAYTVEYLGNICTFENIIDVDMDDFALNFDPLLTYGDVCPGEIIEYEIDYSPYDPTEFTVNWTVPGNAIISSGQGTPTIQVGWLTEGGEVCYTVSNFCVESQENCFTVEVIESIAPEIQLSKDTICIDELLIVDVINIPSNYNSFEWVISGNGVLQSGSTNNPNQIEVNWSTFGNQTVQVLLDDGCENYLVIADIVVKENPIFPELECLIDGDILTIDWDDFEGISNFTLGAMTSNLTGTFDGTSYQINDLNPGDMVTVEIVADGPCGPMSSMIINCIMPDCPTIDLIFINDLPDTICINSSQTQFQLEALDNENNNGNGLFEGIGIVDATNGIFEVNAAGEGQHIISYVYDVNNGDCISKIFDTIYILPEPNLSFQIPDPICVEDTFQISISGLENHFTIVPLFGNPTYVNEDSLGHYSMSFDTPGLKLCSVAVMDPYCGMYEFDFQINVEAEPDLALMCTLESTNSITISWSTDPYFDSFDLFINGNFEINLTTSEFTLQNLATDSTVIFTITPLSIAANCGLTSQIIECTTVDCIDVPFQIQSPVDTLICGTAPLDLIALTTLYDQGQFDGTEYIEWMGTSVDANGIFDPNSATGSFVIQANLIYEDCIYTDEIEFFVEALPNLSLEATSVICIDEQWTLSFNGDIDNSYNYSWSTNSNVSLNGLGSHQIDFDQPGSFEFTINAAKENCIATPFTILVEVQDSVRSPEITCINGVDQIEVSWEVEDSDCNGFFDILLNGSILESDFDGSNYVLENLDLETNYVIEINQNSTCLCPSKSTVIECGTIPCPTDELSIISPLDSICLEGSIMDIQLVAFFANVPITENISWSGNGIDNFGALNLNSIPEGTSTFIATYNNGNCFYEEEIVLYFFGNAEYDYDLTFPICPEDSLGNITILSAPHSDMIFLINGNPIEIGESFSIPIGMTELTINNFGICLESEIINIPMSSPIEVNIMGSPVIAFNQTQNFSLTVTPPGNISEVNWTFNDSIINQSINEFIFSEAGLLCVQFLFENQCVLSDCIEISVRNPNVYIPNIFSPNDDGYNNMFVIHSNDKNAFVENLSIYDRWGNLLFLRENLMIDNPDLQWDGNFKGKLLNPGVYVYSTSLEYSNGEKEKFVGNITLLR